MYFSYILLILVFLLPLLFRTLHTYRPIKIENKNIFNFWNILEVFMLLFSLILLLDPAFEIVYYNIFFYFLILQNIFVIGQTIRRNSGFKNSDYKFILFFILLLVLFAVWIWSIFYFWFYIFIYFYILLLLLVLPIIMKYFYLFTHKNSWQILQSSHDELQEKEK